MLSSPVYVPVDKSEDDVERESQLLECRLTLTEERNAVLVPSAGNGIPGAPAERCVTVVITPVINFNFPRRTPVSDLVKFCHFFPS